MLAKAGLVVVVIRRQAAGRGAGLVRRLRRRIGEGVKVPLVRDAAAVGVDGVGRVVRLGQGRVGTDPLVEHRQAVGQRGDGRQIDRFRLVGSDFERAADLRVGAGHHEREVLHDIDVVGRRLGVVKRRQRVDVHAARVDGDAVLLRAWLLDEDVLDVVDHVVGHTHRAEDRRADVVAVIDLVGVARVSRQSAAGIVGIAGITGIGRTALAKRRVRERRDDQVEVIDQLDGSVRVAGRVGPGQRETQRVMQGVGAERDLPRAALAGGQGVGQALVDEAHGPSGLVGPVVVSQRRHGAAQIGQPPALVVDRAADIVVVPRIDRRRAVDQQRLEQRRAVGALEAAGVKFLHQRQHAADRRGGHAGAGAVPVLVAELLVQFPPRLGPFLAAMSPSPVNVRLVPIERIGGGSD